MARTDEDILAGIIRVRLGREEVRVPTRTIAQAREWKDTLGEAVGGIVTPDVTTTAGFTGLLGILGDRIATMVAAYDTSGQLTVDRITATMDDAQVYATFRTMLEVSYPFVNDVRQALAVLEPLISSGLSGLGTPMNGHSPTGASTPAGSTSA